MNTKANIRNISMNFSISGKGFAEVNVDAVYAQILWHMKANDRKKVEMIKYCKTLLL